MSGKIRKQHKRSAQHDKRVKSLLELNRDEVGKQIQRTMVHVHDEMIELEQDTAKKLSALVGERYLMIRQSKEFPIVCRMILSGASAVDIARYLQTEDEDRFKGVEERTLSRQIARFSNEIISHFTDAAQEGVKQSVPITRLDLIAEKFVNRAFDPLTTIERAILAQEVRLDQAMENEARLPFVQGAVGEELERLTRICSSYLTLRKLLGLAPDKFADAMSQRSVRVTQIKNTFINLPIEKKKELLKLVEYAGTISPSASSAPAKGEDAVPVSDAQSTGA